MLGTMGGSESGAKAFFALGVDAWVYCFQVFDCFDKSEALRDGENTVLFCFIFCEWVSEIGMSSFPQRNGRCESGDGVAYD